MGGKKGAVREPMMADFSEEEELSVRPLEEEGVKTLGLASLDCGVPFGDISVSLALSSFWVVEELGLFSWMHLRQKLVETGLQADGGM